MVHPTRSCRLGNQNKVLKYKLCRNRIVTELRKAKIQTSDPKTFWRLTKVSLERHPPFQHSVYLTPVWSTTMQSKPTFLMNSSQKISTIPSHQLIFVRNITSQMLVSNTEGKFPTTTFIGSLTKQEQWQ